MRTRNSLCIHAGNIQLLLSTPPHTASLTWSLCECECVWVRVCVSVYGGVFQVSGIGSMYIGIDADLYLSVINIWQTERKILKGCLLSSQHLRVP